MSDIITIKNLSKAYASGVQSLCTVSLSIRSGELFALLGPNGAGKTTLISTVCGLTTRTNGQVTVNGYDIYHDYRAARKQIGLVPQEITIDIFDTPWKTVRFSRSLFGLPRNDAYLKDLLKQLSLWDKRDQKMITLSGGMKRRVMIAKALAHEPKILFLDEPTAGVDVELRQAMWKQLQTLKSNGVTIILTTHYIEEAEEMADRIGILNNGRLMLVEDKHTLMKKMSAKTVMIDLQHPLSKLPEPLRHLSLELLNNQCIKFHYNSETGPHTIADVLSSLHTQKLAYVDIRTEQDSLEDIFVRLVNA
ncbi:MAG: ABC transporter ATP-binding protein [Candidatus Marinamargulisbacteria bacterium]|nr:ABC transporter ATP-binding protein [Candidatus Marinamargulisbacteria bacterium]